MGDAIERVIESWRLTASSDELQGPGSEETIGEAERVLGRPIPDSLKRLYRFSDGMGPLGGNLALVPLFDPEVGGLVAYGARLRSWQWPIPDELLMFGGNGGDELFGVWYPPGASPSGPTPVVEVGSIFEPDCLDLAGTDLPRFLLAWSGYYLVITEAPSAAFDALGLPDSLRRVSADGDMAPYFRWADPGLADPPPDPYARRLDALAIASLIGGLQSDDAPRH